MTRKAKEQVATTGIDIGKNSLHLIGLEGCSGSRADENRLPVPRRLLGVEPTESARKQTSRLGRLLTGEEPTN